jgi:hypothetical protein
MDAAFAGADSLSRRSLASADGRCLDLPAEALVVQPEAFAKQTTETLSISSEQ